MSTFLFGLVGLALGAQPPPIVEPYPLLHGFDPSGNPAVPASPDPLVATTWAQSTNITGLQRYVVDAPVAWLANPPSAFAGARSSPGETNITVSAAGSLRLDFGREHAAWFEFESPDLGAQVGAVRASISEYNEPWPGKTQPVHAYAGGVYRLETNSELYEGVRYAWIFFDPVSNPPTCVGHGIEDQPATVLCPTNSGLIKAVKFAEFGTATGDCTTGFKRGNCAGKNLFGNVSKVCIGKSSCKVDCIMGTCTIDDTVKVDIGGDPCPGTPKELTLQVECGGAAPGPAVVPWHITAVRIVNQVKPVNYTGVFKSSDAVLEQSWYSGAYGSRLNMMPYGFNSILMDRGDRVSIQGDGHPTMAAALVAFGSPDTYDLVHKMLVKTDSGCENASNCRVVDSSLMPYPIYWASSVNDWYWASGDTARFLELAPDMMRIIDNAVNKFLQPGLNVAWFGWDDRVANGFCGSCNLEAQLGFASLTIRACNDFAATLKKAGDTVNATRYSTTARALAATLRARPATTVPGGKWYADYGVHAAAYMINAEIVADADEQEAIFHKVLTNSVTICSWSPFNQFWILQALGNLGKMDYAAASIRLCWGPMLTLGKGCFWELFSPEWTRFMEDGDKAPTRPSYCHPWADGVTHWLSHHMAGLAPLKPGFRRYSAMPHVSGSNPDVAATLATPHGPVSVEARRDNRAGMVTVSVSARVFGVVGLRLHDEATGCALDLTTVMLDGVPAEAQMAAAVSDVVDAVNPTMAGQHGYVTVGPGAHTVTASFPSSCVTDFAAADAAVAALAAAPPPAKGLPSVPPFPPAEYPGSWTIDGATRGAWRGKYGTAGYQLFAFHANGTDAVELPSWVESIKVKDGASSYVGTDATNASFLHDPAGGPASLGFTTRGADGSQGTVIDINITAGTTRTVTLYMVGNVMPVGKATSSFTKQAIRVMDLETLNPIAPDPLIKDDGNGVYWSLAYSRGVRLRVMPIDSDAGWSGLFFD